MSIRRTVLVAALCAAPLLSAPLSHAQPPQGAGGCGQGGLMTGRLIPGSGSSGQTIRREATLTDCASPLLPGITAGRFDVSIPWNVTTATTTATFAWSNGATSIGRGYGNGIWLITEGPATGHGIQINAADTWTGWYLSPMDVPVTSATFVS